MIEICVASNNKNKIRQFGEIFKSAGVDSTLYTSKELGFSNYPPEDADTFQGNALIKARSVAKFLRDNMPEREIIVIADDSGLCVDALFGEPGVKSARYASTNDIDDAKDEDNNKKLISKLKALCEKDANTDLSAHYECAIAAVFPDGSEKTTKGQVLGKIVFEPKGNDGFGYDPYFFVDCYQKCFAELTIEERNAISHRGKALRALIAEM